MKSSLLQECLRISARNNKTHPERGNYQHFCFVVQNNKIVEWSTNRPGAAVQMFGFMPHRHKIHAEVDAFRKAKGVLQKNKPFEVVNIRLTIGGQVRISAPCECCSRFLAAMDCKRIWFTTGAGWAKMAV